MSRYLAILLEVLIILLIVFVPLACGGTHYWAWTLMELGVALALMLWLVLALVNRRLCVVKTPLNIIIVALLAIVFMQLVPLPSRLANMLSGSRVALQVTGDPSAKGYTTATDAVPLSVNRGDTLQSWFRMLAYGGFFFLLVNFLDTRAKIGRVLGAAVLVGVVVAFLGMASSSQRVPELYRTFPTGDSNETPTSLNMKAERQFSSGVGYETPLKEDAKVHWFISKAKGASAFGSFPSQDQAAGFLLMLLPVSIGVLFACMGTRGAEWGSSGGFVFSREGNLAILALVVTLVLIVGVVMTQSRPGVAAMLVVVTVALLAVGFTGSWVKGLVTTAILAALIIGAGLTLKTSDVVSGGVKDWTNYWLNPWNTNRVNAVETSGKIASDFPLMGTGAGTFGSVYPIYSQGGPQAYFAFCDASQLRAENGWVGFLVMVAGLVVFVVTGVWGLVRMQDKFMRRVLAGTLVGAAALVGHSMMTFDFYVPATALVFTVLAAVTVALAQDVNSRKTEEDYVF